MQIKGPKHSLRALSVKVAITYSPAFPEETITIGVIRFNFSVRNGKRWSPYALIT